MICSCRLLRGRVSCRLSETQIKNTAGKSDVNAMKLIGRRINGLKQWPITILETRVN